MPRTICTTVYLPTSLAHQLFRNIIHTSIACLIFCIIRFLFASLTFIIYYENIDLNYFLINLVS